MAVDAPGTERTVTERLLDAALEVAADHGLSRLSVGDVAPRAGLSRQTLYKHFASKDDLVSQTVIREAGRIVEAVIEASDAEPDPLRSLELAVLAALQLVRGHPLLDRLLATEPETLLPLMVDGQGSVLGGVHLVCRQMIAARFPELSEQQSNAGADLLSRMLVSYAVRPPELAPQVVARSLSYAVVAAILTPSMAIPSPAPAPSQE
jgi:AcrR family transcriptional regulator